MAPAFSKDLKRSKFCVWTSVAVQLRTILADEPSKPNE